MSRWPAREGSAQPLGATWIESERAYNFALYSRHATAVTLLLYGADDFVTPLHQQALTHLRHRSGRVWHCRITEAQVPAARYYAYVVDGPNGDGQRFDPGKILLDPYATGIFFPPRFSRQAARQPDSNAGRAPLGVLRRAHPFDWGDDRRPVHEHDTIIYEMHVRGFTRRASSGVPASRRGTFAGVVDKIPYLRELGITVVELLPVYQYDPDEGNYWGYMPLSFFCPHQSYATAADADAVLDEFRTMVKALHAADIEIVLDVVYNHTAEEGPAGPTYSYRGIDNSTYYLLDPRDWSYRNDAGTGNVVRSAHPAVRKLILDSMRFWVKEMHVDGFRFDLASIFTRNNDGSINVDDPAVIAEISADPDFAGVRLIAEAWDLGTNQLGRSFPGITWLQWNGHFRDDVRSAVKSDASMVAALMRRFYGSDDLFPDEIGATYHPYQSVNFVTAHDGFCLYDLVAYNLKHNSGSGGGTDDNRSWNCGWEGDAGAPDEVLGLRRRQVKNFCALLFLANGTPMFVAGDEFMNTQRGNNNPYNQDNETTWLDWDRYQKNDDVFRFWQRMIAFRKAHPSLGRSRYWRNDIRWYGVGQAPDLSPDSRSLALCVHGAAENDDDVYVMVNTYWEELSFTVQEGAAGDWRRVVDTSLASPDDIAEPGHEPVLSSLAYRVGPRSVVVLFRPRITGETPGDE